MDFGVEDVEIEVVVDWVEFQHYSTFILLFHLVSLAIFSPIYNVIFFKLFLGFWFAGGILGIGVGVQPRNMFDIFSRYFSNCSAIVFLVHAPVRLATL